MPAIVKHNQGSAGGYLQGRKHTQGGIKAVNKSTGQPLEMEGGEVVVTAKAVQDNSKKHEFNGRMLTNRQILSEINVSGGGVSFAEGGKIPGKIKYKKGLTYKVGGQVMDAEQVVKHCGCGCEHAMAEGGAVNALQEAIKLLRAKKDLDTLYETMLEIDPEGLVKMIAQQAQGIGADGKRTEKYDVAHNSAEIAFGKKIVDLSIQAFPAGKMEEGGEINTPLGFNEFKSKYHRIYHYRNEGTREWQLSIHSERFPGYHTFYSTKENLDDAYKDIYEAYKIWVNKGSKMERGGTMRKKINLPAGIDNDEPHNSLEYQHYKHGGKVMANGGTVEYDVTKSLLSEFEYNKQRSAVYGGQKWVNRIPASAKVTEESLSFIPPDGIKTNRVSNQLLYGYDRELSNDQKRFVIRGLMDGKLKIVETVNNYILLHKDSRSMARGGETGSDEDTLMSKVDFIRLLKKLEPFVPRMQIQALGAIYNTGEEKEFAVEKAQQLLGYFEKMPKTYGTEKQKEDDKIVYLHYFYGASDWYIVEKDKLPEQQQAFGYAILNGDYEMSEWGYISLEEILSVRKIELDFYFTPKRFGEVKKKWEPDEEPEEKKSVGIASETVSYPTQTDEDLDDIDKDYDPNMGKQLKEIFKQYWSEGSIKDRYKIKDYSFDGLNLHLTFDKGEGWLDLSRKGKPHSYSPNNFERLKELRMRILGTVNMETAATEIRGIANDLGFKPSQVIIGKVAQPETSEAQPERLFKIGDKVRLKPRYLKKEPTMQQFNQATIKELSSYYTPETGYMYDTIISQDLSPRHFYESEIELIEQTQAPAVVIKQQATITPAQQTSTNEKIRALVKAKGADRKKYSASELSLLKLYEGAGAEKKTSTDVRILDQFFTPMDIVARMWGMALKHGFNFHKTSVLEPSVGSGRFLQYIPLPSPQVIVSVTAYDVDETCATICKVLFPYFKIVHGSFESLFFRGNTHIGLAGVTQFYDLVIGNPPYRDYVSPYAPLGEKANTGATTFEMYFIARGVDVLKKGGLLIYIIPNTFMSNGSKYNEFKEKLAKKCDLVDAYRLPNGVFGNTEIGTDIICLRKK